MSAELLALAPILYIAFLFSTVCHEAAHALVARWGGDDTAYVGGQVSLDPLPHIKREPVGLVLVPLLMLFSNRGIIGWGSAPFDPYWQVRYPRRAALMALAGPVTNALLAIIAGIGIRIGLETGTFVVGGSLGISGLVTAPGGGLLDGLATLLSVLFTLNVLLAVFNLLPVPPLDGYSILPLIISERASLKLIEASRNPLFSLIGFLIAWNLFPTIVPPVLVWSYSVLFAPF